MYVRGPAGDAGNVAAAFLGGDAGDAKKRLRPRFLWCLGEQNHPQHHLCFSKGGSFPLAKGNDTICSMKWLTHHQCILCRKSGRHFHHQSFSTTVSSSYSEKRRETHGSCSSSLAVWLRREILSLATSVPQKRQCLIRIV